MNTKTTKNMPFSKKLYEEEKNILKKVRDLMARATHKETPPEEARTCAMRACEIITTQEILLAPGHAEGHIAEWDKKIEKMLQIDWENFDWNAFARWLDRRGGRR